MLDLRVVLPKRGASYVQDQKEVRSVIRPCDAFFMGKYNGVSANAFQFAVLRAAPHRYNAIINDCVEFSKEFCLCLLSYCTNWRTLEEEINRRIKEVSTTGLSVERLSRRVHSSGKVGYSSLTGVDISSLFGSRHGNMIFTLHYATPGVSRC